MPRFTVDDLSRITAQSGYAVESKVPKAPAADMAGLRSAQPKRDAQHAPLGQDEGEGQGETRYTVCITRASTRTLDKDNLYGSAKWICDGLRYCGLIPDDNPQAIDLIVRQVKVPKEKVGTLIEIT